MAILPSGCEVCRKQGSLHCGACKAALYCSKEHQKDNWDDHRPVCKKTKRALARFHHEEKLLRETPGDFMMPADPLTNSVGRFWGIYGTRDYMRARYEVVTSMLLLDTRKACEVALDHLMDMMRLCHGDDMGLRFQIPHLMLRLGQDQEVCNRVLVVSLRLRRLMLTGSAKAYDFIKWWTWQYNTSDCSIDDGDADATYMNIKNANAFDPIRDESTPDRRAKSWASVSHAVAILLLKIKLHQDLEGLTSAALLKQKMPKEIILCIRQHVPSSNIVFNKKAIMLRDSQTKVMADLEAQIRDTIQDIGVRNKHMIPALLNPAKHLGVLPSAYSPGSVEDMQLVLSYCFKAWLETEGALDFLRNSIVSAK